MPGGGFRGVPLPGQLKKHMSEIWSQLTTDDVLGEFTPVEQAVLKNIKSGKDALADIVGRVIDQVRKAYLDGGRTIDVSEATIPDGEKPRAIAIARWKLLISFPSLKFMQTADRKAANDDAQNYFMEVAKRELTGDGGSQVVSSQTRRATRAKMEGLI